MKAHSCMNLHLCIRPLVLNKIGDEIMTTNSLKELCASLKEDYKDVEHLKENIPPHFPQVTVTQNSGNVSDLDSEEPVKIEEPGVTKKPSKEQRNINNF
ncbi:hypothetical protein QTO34_015360 [Cnephaeus nilssonii]|uniref:Uncharacterized protein n=1 Tax=Cnephaeus nilssonii TaxID=3371016 RepID=A0AA40I418_CNENI|nr:hypothetical protein QTO34_015360 [Eptesicus nilssonii]